MVNLALSQGLMGDPELLVSDPLFSHHRGSRLLDLGKVLVVDIVKRHQLRSRVVFVQGWNISILLSKGWCAVTYPWLEILSRFTKRLILTGGYVCARARPQCVLKNALDHIWQTGKEIREE